ncbi:MAG: DivIVA domain-containing protein [Clostridia bacterium]|nr:DivIVA domain-containing protein [Clostridia bacterium]
MNRDDVINKVFPHSLFGYDPVAVDAFLDEVIREFDRMTNTIDVLQFKLTQELGSAKMTNDVLAAQLARTAFEYRAEQFLPEHMEPAPEETEPEAACAEAAPAETAPEKADEPEKESELAEAAPAETAPQKTEGPENAAEPPKNKKKKHRHKH